VLLAGNSQSIPGRLGTVVGRSDHSFVERETSGKDYLRANRRQALLEILGGRICTATARVEMGEGDLAGLAEGRTRVRRAGPDGWIGAGLARAGREGPGVQAPVAPRVGEDKYCPRTLLDGAD